MSSEGQPTEGQRASSRGVSSQRPVAPQAWQSPSQATSQQTVVPPEPTTQCPCPHSSSVVQLAPSLSAPGTTHSPRPSHVPAPPWQGNAAGASTALHAVALLQTPAASPAPSRIRRRPVPGWARPGLKSRGPAATPPGGRVPGATSPLREGGDLCMLWAHGSGARASSLAAPAYSGGRGFSAIFGPPLKIALSRQRRWAPRCSGDTSSACRARQGALPAVFFAGSATRGFFRFGSCFKAVVEV